MNWIELKAAFLRTNWLTNQLTNIQFKTSLRLKLSQRSRGLYKMRKQSDKWYSNLFAQAPVFPALARKLAL